VQHGRTYANLERDDDVLSVGANRAIDLIVTKETGGNRFRRGNADPGRALGEDPASGRTVVVKGGRFGPYVTDGEINATLPKAVTQEAVTLDEALALIATRRASGATGKKGRFKKAGGAKKAPAKKTAAKKAAAKKSAAKKPAKASSKKPAPAKRAAG